MKREAVHHSKMKRLCRKLNLDVWQAMGLLEAIWHVTARETPRGDIGKLSDEDIAIAIDYHDDVGQMITALIESGWLERNKQHRLVVHDWPDHAEDGVHMKIARARQFFIRQDTEGQTILEAPKMSRLNAREREPLLEFYISTNNEIRAHAVRTKPQSVRTKPQSVRTKPQSVRSSARCLDLDPALAPPLEALEQTAATNGTREISKLAAADFPKTTELLTRKFPAIDSAMVSRIIQAATQAWCSVDNPRIPEPGDEVYVAAIEAAKNGKQTSAALFLRTVPTVISNWARSGRPVSPGAVDPSKISPYNPLKFKKGISEK